MIQSFRDKGTQDIFNGLDTPTARNKCPKDTWSIVCRKLDQINRAANLHDLAVPPGNRLERLKGKRTGQSSIRINDQYRICFHWEDRDAYDIEITDHH